MGVVRVLPDFRPTNSSNSVLLLMRPWAGDLSRVFTIGLIGETCGLVAPTHRQAEVLATNLCGGSQRYESVSSATRLKVSGIELFSAGNMDASSSDVCIRSSDQSLYRRIGFDGEKLIGGVLLGDITGARFIEQSLGQVVTSPEHREKLAFGL